MKFIFDLDGTVTAKETLPIISNHFGINDDISALTKQTIAGDIPFIESFIKRVHILGELPVSEINDLLSNVPLLAQVINFINLHNDDCIIATGNFSGWVDKLCQRIGCQYFCSSGIVNHNKIEKLTHILKKEEIVSKFKDLGHSIVFIGDGNNDVTAMQKADVSIACGVVHSPAKSVLTVADYAVFNENSLVRILNQIRTQQSGKSVIISCAGIGSRLGLGLTKALIKINDKPLIHSQLEAFTSVEDVRVVVGFQSSEVIKAVLEQREDVIFVYNHDYFHTKTGASYYLGARHGNEYAIAWDGDLIVHPHDIKKILSYCGEFVCCSKTITDDAVFVQLDGNNNAIRFTDEPSNYEWSGPACLKRNNIKYTSGHVFYQIENHLPLPALVVRAQDIDTYEDYSKAKEILYKWSLGNKNIDCYYAKMAKAIKNPIETRNKAKDSSKYDIELMKSISNPSKKLLDLGSGTGLIVNHLESHFKKIVAVEKYHGFSKHINISKNIDIINCDLLQLKIDDSFDFISLFGVMNYFNADEAREIYRMAFNLLSSDGILVIKNQMGIDDDVIVNGFSDELKMDYYSEYRQLDKEISLLQESGFTTTKTIDIYPSEFNRWDSTHFYALICAKSTA